MAGEQSEAQDVSISKSAEGLFSNRLFKNPEDKLGRRFNKEGNVFCFPGAAAVYEIEAHTDSTEVKG